MSINYRREFGHAYFQVSEAANWRSSSPKQIVQFLDVKVSATFLSL